MKELLVYCTANSKVRYIIVRLKLSIFPQRNILRSNVAKNDQIGYVRTFLSPPHPLPSSHLLNQSNKPFLYSSIIYEFQMDFWRRKLTDGMWSLVYINVNIDISSPVYINIKHRHRVRFTSRLYTGNKLSAISSRPIYSPIARFWDISSFVINL